MAEPILIFGGTGGIGSAIASALRSKGEAVHLVAREQGRLADLAGRIGATYSVADVEDGASIAKAVEDAASVGRRCAQGPLLCRGYHHAEAAGAAFGGGFRTGLPHQRSGRGQGRAGRSSGLKKAEGAASVLLFSTVAVAQGFTAHASVAMAKGAIEGLTLALAAELAPKMRVNCHRALADPHAARRGARRRTSPWRTRSGRLHAMQRLGEGADIAPLAALLLSDEASWITGQIIGVDGGRSSLRTKG